MATFPLIDPDLFFLVLPDMPKREPDQKYDSKYFDKYDYLIGEQNTRISAGHGWGKKRAVSDPYDMDLLVNIIYHPSDGQAKDGFFTEGESNKKLFGNRITNIAFAPALHAEDNRFLRMAVGNRTTFIFDARYGNYQFHFVASLNIAGYFESEESVIERLQALDTHIHKCLLSTIN